MFLIVIKPPNNAETAFQMMKNQIYRETALLSSWALLPFVPVASVDEVELSMSRKELPVVPDDGLALNTIECINDQYCIGSQGLQEFCLRTSELFKNKSGFKISICGLHLFDSSECSGDCKSALKLSRELYGLMSSSEYVWNSCSLEILRINRDIFYEPNWWRRVETETVASFSFPKSL